MNRASSLFTEKEEEKLEKVQLFVALQSEF